MAATMSVLGLILVSFPYLRSAKAWFLLWNICQAVSRYQYLLHICMVNPLSFDENFSNIHNALNMLNVFNVPLFLTQALP